MAFIMTLYLNREPYCRTVLKTAKIVNVVSSLASNGPVLFPIALHCVTFVQLCRRCAKVTGLMATEPGDLKHIRTKLMICAGHTGSMSVMGAASAVALSWFYNVALECNEA